MYQNQNFYNNFTFQHNFYPNVPPPPRQISDEEYIKNIEKTIPLLPETQKKPTVLISDAKKHLREIILLTNQLKDTETYLKNQTDMSKEDWNAAFEEIKTKKVLIDGLMIQVTDSYLEPVKKALAKRSAKRARLKRLSVEKKLCKQELMQEWEERSWKIDEDLQKIQDDVRKCKQEESLKIQVDLILKDTLRKKSDAKKYISKLEALCKLRKARLNTAKGSGVAVSESESEAFNDKIGKIKSLWQEKLLIYDREEAGLRAKLSLDTVGDTVRNDVATLTTLTKWCRHLFGGVKTPQRDFGGDVMKFVGVRSQWDKYIHPAGTSIPIGWVLPTESQKT